MRLVELNIKGFRLFPNETTVHFPAHGVVGIRGFNVSTGSGSDSGKSSILEALATVFGYSSFPVTQNQTWLSKTKMQLHCVCVHDEHRYDFRVGAKTGVHIDGQEVEKARGATAYKKWLAAFFGVDQLEILKYLTYRPQREGGLFLGMSGLQKREFFTSILGLQQYEKIADQSADKIKELDRELITVTASAAALAG